MGFPKQKVIDDTHAFVETRDLHPKDRFLRSHGYRIAWRPKAGPDLWVRGQLDGPEYTEAQALAACGWEKPKFEWIEPPPDVWE